MEKRRNLSNGEKILSTGDVDKKEQLFFSSVYPQTIHPQMWKTVWILIFSCTKFILSETLLTHLHA